MTSEHGTDSGNPGPPWPRAALLPPCCRPAAALGCRHRLRACSESLQKPEMNSRRRGDPCAPTHDRTPCVHSPAAPGGPGEPRTGKLASSEMHPLLCALCSIPLLRMVHRHSGLHRTREMRAKARCSVSQAGADLHRRPRARRRRGAGRRASVALDAQRAQLGQRSYSTLHKRGSNSSSGVKGSFRRPVCLPQAMQATRGLADTR